MPTDTYLKSSIWNGIKKHVHTVNDNMKWLLGSGHSVSFWLDNWLDEPLAVKFNFPVTIYPLLKAKVSSFIENGEWILPATFVNHDVSIRDSIHEIILPRQPMEDRLIWCAYNDENLTAKQAYVLLFPTQQKLDWTSWIWHNFVPPSSSFVAWHCFQNRMPTDENLRSGDALWFLPVTSAYRNQKQHLILFLTCSFTNNLWKWMGSILHIQFNCSSFHSLFESFDASWSAFLTNIATAAVLHVFHSIWLARNDIRFSNAKITMHAAQSKILTASKLSTTLAPGLSNAAEIVILQKFQLAPRPAAASSNRLVLWRSPIFGWMKANIDGSVTNVSAAYGGLFRDHTTRFRGCFAQKLSENHGLSIIHTEIMALIIAIVIAHNKNWNCLWLESDSKVALLAFSNIEIVPWDLRNRWLTFLACGVTLQWSHIYREGNLCADKIANLGHAYNNLEWWESLPSLLRDDFLRDMLGIPQYRTI
ncbi:unnamed protein product [Trifolium pratense]|uniref:Uncharacterized protein n=1 Tax=Trifolium pratense TaxID=57577 RepID=A0ACB0IY00_TRIPR|nr:unnamed protein product [Trifolium pratense]